MSYEVCALCYIDTLLDFDPNLGGEGIILLITCTIPELKEQLKEKKLCKII